MKSGEWGKKYDQEIDAITLKGDISVAVHINSYPISWIRLDARKMLRTAVASLKHAVASVWVVNQKWQTFFAAFNIISLCLSVRMSVGLPFK